MKTYKVLKPIADIMDVNDVLNKEDLAEYFTKTGIECLIGDKYIEEIQEPEFTQREMKDRCVNFLHSHSGHTLSGSIEMYDDWIKAPGK